MIIITKILQYAEFCTFIQHIVFFNNSSRFPLIKVSDIFDSFQIFYRAEMSNHYFDHYNWEVQEWKSFQVHGKENDKKNKKRWQHWNISWHSVWQLKKMTTQMNNREIPSA